MGRIRNFLALSTSEQVLLVVAAVLFAVFSVTLRAGSLAANERFARRLAEAGLTRWSVERVDRAVSIIESTRPGSGGCLPAALVGLALTDDVAPELRLGVRASGDSIEAHAWLTCADGRLLYAGEDPAKFRQLEER